VLFVLSGACAVLAATLVSLGSIPVIVRSLRLGDGPSQETVLRVVGAEEEDKSAG
jgi:hypothetical protein